MGIFDIFSKQSNKVVQNDNQKKDERKKECPYCNNPLKKIPGSKTKCPHCGKYIFVRTDPSNRSRILATDEQAKEIEKKLKIQYALEELKKVICDVDEKYSEIINDLKNKTSIIVLDGDLLWATSNKLLLEMIKKNDFQEMGLIYSAQASFLYNSGKDSFRILQEARKCELRNYKKSGFVKKVEIISANDNQCCLECQKLNGKILTIEEALKTMPIPVKNCSVKLDSENLNRWCRCIYGPALD